MATIQAPTQDGHSAGQAPAALSISGVSKTFGAARALVDFALDIEAGEVHALIGENGSGKSTFIKILAGYHSPDPGGEALIGGVPLDLGSATDAYAKGCRFVHQDLGLVGDLSVMDNLFLNAGFPTTWGSVFDRSLARRAREVLDRFELDIDPRMRVAELSPAQRTGVAVCRSLMEDPANPVKLVVFDEPTATLPGNEVGRLLGLVRSVASSGAGVLYVTHRLDEIFGLAKRVSVLRDGHKVAMEPVDTLTRREVVNLLVGSEFDEAHAEATEVVDPEGAPVLSVKNLVSVPIRGVSLQVRKHEIVGIAGITGSGRETILAAVFGGTPRDGGEVFVGEEALAPESPSTSVAKGLAYVPADRKVLSGIMDMSARENVTISNVTSIWSWPMLRRGKEKREIRHWIDAMDVRPADGAERSLGTFSGGNQQKLMLAKWLRNKPAVILLDEPTQGVDVGAKATIYHHLVQAADADAAVVISSSDVDELAALCHRVLIMRDGVITNELTGPDVTVARISRDVLGRQ